MFFELIQKSAKRWYLEQANPASEIILYIQKKGKLRDAQIEAIQIYLFLKIACQGKPLYDLFCEGYFLQGVDLETASISQVARTWFSENTAARMLYELAIQADDSGKEVFPKLKDALTAKPGNFDSEVFFRKIFYNIDYTDYLFSLPMGAGKTYLMAAFIYLDLYFSMTEPENSVWARNFLLLVPSGLKSSIIPSLRTIEDFDPAWVLPEPTASNLKRQIHFEVLDQPKTGKKSNRTDNPNVAKLLTLQPFDDLRGLIMLVNAEKVILDKVSLNTIGLELSEDEEEKQANELRHLIGNIPGKMLLIDEVHHATDSDIKLRQVVNGWQSNQNVACVLGFSGTPYLSSAETIEFTEDLAIKSKEITNVVYYYPLIQGIGNFLKKPTVNVSTVNNPLSIIKDGIGDFHQKYGNLKYKNGVIAKIAIYCGGIDRLEEEVYPYLIKNLKINPDEILKYHKGNKNYKVPVEAELEFRSLDLPYSKKRYILLVQVGKEGWDCRSLTGVILSNKGDCPTNMVLQTSCRCLREVEDSTTETATIWLNKDNGTTLDKQLAQEQKTSIDEINKHQHQSKVILRDQISRAKQLKLPKLTFYQIDIKYHTTLTEAEPDIRNNLVNLLSAIKQSDKFKSTAIISRTVLGSQNLSKEVLEFLGEETADFENWLSQLSKNSMGQIKVTHLETYRTEIQNIYSEITYEKNGKTVFNQLYKVEKIENAIRLAFYPHRELKIEDEIVPKDAHLVVAGKLKPVYETPLLFPDNGDQETILSFDAENTTAQVENSAIETLRQELLKKGQTQAQIDRRVPKSVNYSDAILHKDRTLHYLPYNFSQSRFEKSILEESLTLTDLTDIEIYFNGEKHLTEFRIDCMQKTQNGRWKKVGMYTPDFLLLSRQKGAIHKVLIVETKGSGFAEQSQFVARRNFVENEFLKINNDKFGYGKFEYLYLSDSDKPENNLTKLVTKAKGFFQEQT